MGANKARWGGLLAATLAACAGAESDGRFGDPDAAPAGDDGIGEGSGDDGSDDGEPGPPPRAGDDDATVVPLSTPTVAWARACQPMPPAATVYGSSPNGDLWYGVAGELHALGADGIARTWDVDWPVHDLRPWTSTEATVASGAGLWRLDDGHAASIRWLDDHAMPSALCGDPSAEGDGFVVADDLFSRDLGQWWRWNLPGLPVASTDLFAVSAGTCSGETGVAWLRRGDAVWSVAADWVGAHPELAPSSAIAADDSFGVASIVDAGLVLLEGEAQTNLRFEAGEPTAIAAAPGALWAQAGGRLYRRVDGSFVEVTVDGEPAAVLDLWPDAAGVWVGDADTLCRVAPPGVAALQLRGLREYQRVRQPDLAFTIAVVDSSTLEVTLDGNPLAFAPTETEVTIELTELPEGWHTLVAATPDQGRTVPFEVQRLTPATWEDDIQPLFAGHCSGPACHGADEVTGTQPDLSTYEAWSERADTIAARVVATGDMPPLSAGDEHWGVDEVLLIAGWLEAGLPRKDEQ